MSNQLVLCREDIIQDIPFSHSYLLSWESNLNLSSRCLKIQCMYRERAYEFMYMQIYSDVFKI